jgi:hypothetical protein
MSNPKLPSPPKCSAGRSLKLQNINPIYDGPRNNNANIFISLPKISKKHGKGLAYMSSEIPENFSWKDKSYIETPRQQGGCGSCWAFASATCLGDRYAIKFDIKALKPSVAWILTCATDFDEKQICKQGGAPEDAIEFLSDKGGKLESCWPYSMIENNSIGSWVSYPCLNSLDNNCCYSCCGEDNNSNIILKTIPNSAKHILNYNGRNPDVNETIRNIQREIMTKGPVISCYAVFNDFTTFWNDKAYKGDVYFPDISSGVNGGHAVVLTGWGKTSDGVNYWEMRNSWGTDKGMNGYCRMAFSNQVEQKNWCGIDVPTQALSSGSWQGGVITFDISDKKPSGENTQINSEDEKKYNIIQFMKINWIFFVIGLIVIIILIII